MNEIELQAEEHCGLGLAAFQTKAALKGNNRRIDDFLSNHSRYSQYLMLSK